MNKFFLLSLLFLFFATWMAEPASTHGGQYTPPGDTVPPNIGNPSGPTTPGGSTGPTTPGPQGPSIAGPKGPATPTAPLRGGPRRGGAYTRPSRGRGSASMGMERWEIWWGNNKDAFLDLKTRFGAHYTYSGSGTFLIGRGRKEIAQPSGRPSTEVIRTQVLPSLIAALDSDHPDILDSALLAIARTTPASDADLVLARIEASLQSRFVSVRQAACLSLGVLGSPKACQTCYDLMIDNRAGRKLVGGEKVPQTIRAFGALSLGLINSAQSAPKLRLVVDKEDARTQKDLIACAITALGLMNDTSTRDETVRFLIEKFFDTRIDAAIRAYIPVALGRLGDGVALTPLINWFRQDDQDPRLARSCAVAMGRLATVDDSEAISLLIKAVSRSKDALTRHYALIALAQIGARDKRSAAHEKEHQAIARLFLSQIARPTKPQHRAWASLAGAIYARGQDGQQGKIISKIRESFHDTRNLSDKSAMAVSLGLLTAAGHAEMLFDALAETKNKAFQGYLCVSLGLMNWRRENELICDLAQNASVAALRLQAATALGLMGDREAVDVLVLVLRNSRALPIVSSAAKALGLIGDKSAIAPLKEILADDSVSDLGRAFAAVALGILGEKSQLPWNAAITADSNYSVRVDAIREIADIL